MVATYIIFAAVIAFLLVKDGVSPLISDDSIRQRQTMLDRDLPRWYSQAAQNVLGTDLSPWICVLELWAMERNYERTDHLSRVRSGEVKCE